MERAMIEIEQILSQEYGLEMKKICPMTTGVGGKTFSLDTQKGKYLCKIADSNAMNHPKEEPDICTFLRERKIPATSFLRTRKGELTTVYKGNVLHVQRFVEGKTFAQNQAPDWYMEETPALLGKMHTALLEYRELPEGIGRDFFEYMTPESVYTSYCRSIERAKTEGDEGILNDLNIRLHTLEKMKNWKFDITRLTCRNTHGDYTVNQIICGEHKINAVIDFTSACRHPVIWEITRSFYLAEPTCKNGELCEDKFKEYVYRYESEATLNKYDKDNLLRLYYYQLAVCDYYAQYFDAENSRKAEYLQQAKFATAILKNL